MKRDGDFFRRGAGITRAELLAIVAVLAVLIALVWPMLVPRPKQQGSPGANLAMCKENLRRIGVGLLEYAADHGGALPIAVAVDNPQGALVGALVEKYVVDPHVFYCPSEVKPELCYSEEHFKAGRVGYFYYSASQASSDAGLSQFLLSGVQWPRELKLGMDGQRWVMSDIWRSGDPTAHAGYKKGVNYLMLDGSVGFVSESPRQAFH